NPSLIPTTQHHNSHHSLIYHDTSTPHVYTLSLHDALPICETFDETKMITMNVGNFLTMPKEMRHFAMSKGETIVQVHGAGPFKVDRKSTRLNSSHVAISYAVFCLKKKSLWISCGLMYLVVD